jgi:hypothetical protein
MPDAVIAWRAQPSAQLERVLIAAREVASELHASSEPPTRT